ncbi:ribonuclease J [Telmatospirillum sp. J64-1]|uniref:ribonuclease J n=1 Tax=Telmatospirillum sp. J64-1 TaxID=2502183 RepID=UPI00115F55D5|nr:ribonuclease J [Telmatospirillum sp. J64-1]
MTNSNGTNFPPRDELIFLPLGGAGEIGMNLNLYGCAGKWLMVDLGVSFGDDYLPGIEVVMPDPAFIEEQREHLAGLVVTHGHEDHLGAVAWLWPRLRCPIYATPFAAALLRNKLHEHGLTEDAEVSVVELGSRFEVGPFDIELITLTHSIPEPNALAIRTPHGTVLHTGDWKFDPSPLVGEASDLDALRRLGSEGVLALVGDSTNVFTPGHARSEAEVRESLVELFGRFTGRIAVGCFATNVARLESIAHAAAAHGRQVALVGRSLWRVQEAARENGYLADTPAFLNEHDAAHLPKDKLVYICTGSQGEPRAALSRIASGNHPHVSLGKGDVVVFSSRMIPGNEKAIARLQDALVKQGVQLITEKDHFVHVSGHPGREELAEMYHMVRPQVAVPVHGEARHLIAHAKLARDCQVPKSVVMENGAVLRLAPGEPEIVDHVHSGRLAVDGTRVVPMQSEILRARHRALFNGSAVVTLVVDEDGLLLAKPKLTATGILDPHLEAEEHEAVVMAVRDAVEDLPQRERRDDAAITEAARLAVRRSLRDSHGKKPITDVHLVRV